MIVQKSTNWRSKSGDVSDYRFLQADVSEGFPYCEHTTARTGKPFAVSVQDAESDNEEGVNLQTLSIGCVISVTAGEAIAKGELVCPGAAGKAFDADSSTDVVVGTAVSAAAADGDIVQVLIDANFSSVVA